MGFIGQRAAALALLAVFGNAFVYFDRDPLQRSGPQSVDQLSAPLIEWASQGEYINVTGGRMWTRMVKRSGSEPAASAIALIHGFPSSSHDFHRVIPHLSERTFCIISVLGLTGTRCRHCHVRPHWIRAERQAASRRLLYRRVRRQRPCHMAPLRHQARCALFL